MSFQGHCNLPTPGHYELSSISLEKSSYLFLASFWLFSKLGFRLQQKRSFPNTNSMMTVLCLKPFKGSYCFQETQILTFHTKPDKGSLSSTLMYIYLPLALSTKTPLTFCHLFKKCHAISFLHRTFTHFLSFAWNIIFPTSTKLSPPLLSDRSSRTISLRKPFLAFWSTSSGTYVTLIHYVYLYL